jgi:hypothetical protein
MNDLNKPSSTLCVFLKNTPKKLEYKIIEILDQAKD